MGYSFLPDLPTETPETWRVCDGFHPTIYGAYRTGWLASNVTALSATSEGSGGGFSTAFAYQISDGTAQVVMGRWNGGATSRLYVWNGSAWNDRYGGGNLFAAFCQVGNITLAGSVTSGIYQRDATGAANFAAVASGPAKSGVLMVNALGIVMSLDTTSDTYATSDTNAPTIWTGGEASNSSVRLTQGNFTAGVALGSDFIVFKERGIYRATYVGGQEKWRFTLIDAEKGAWGRGSVVNADGRIVFLGKSGAYVFDGASFERIDSGIFVTLLYNLGADIALAGDYRETRMVWDPNTQNVYVFALGNTALGSRQGTANLFFSYSVVSKKWGFQSRLKEAGTDNFQAVFDIAALNGYASSVGSYPAIAAGPVYKTNVGFFSVTADRVQALTTSFNPTDLPGTNYKPNLRTNRFGQRDVMTYVERFIPNWTLADGIGTDLSTATVKTATHYFADSTIESNTTGDTVNLTTDQNWADLRKTARWHNVELKVNAETIIDGGTWVSKPAGTN